jgi:hypothetical protein
MDPVAGLWLANWRGPEMNCPATAFNHDIGILLDAREPARARLAGTEPGEAVVIDNPKVRSLVTALGVGAERDDLATKLRGGQHQGQTSYCEYRCDHQEVPEQSHRFSTASM